MALINIIDTIDSRLIIMNGNCDAQVHNGPKLRTVIGYLYSLYKFFVRVSSYVTPFIMPGCLTALCNFPDILNDLKYEETCIKYLYANCTDVESIVSRLKENTIRIARGQISYTLAKHAN